MKHLKTFESHEVKNHQELNEGLIEDIKKSVTGYETPDGKKKAMEDFQQSLKLAEEKVKEDPDKYYFDKKAAQKAAKENNYLGSLRFFKLQGKYKGKVSIFYLKGRTDFDEIAKGAANAVEQNTRK